MGSAPRARTMVGLRDVHGTAIPNRRAVTTPRAGEPEIAWWDHRTWSEEEGGVNGVNEVSESILACPTCGDRINPTRSIIARPGLYHPRCLTSRESSENPEDRSEVGGESRDGRRP